MIRGVAYLLPTILVAVVAVALIGAVGHEVEATLREVATAIQAVTNR